MKPISTFWLSKLILMERRLLLHYGVAEEIANRANGSFLMNAFVKGWDSAKRRGMGDERARFMCPYDKQQCDYPKCLSTNRNYRDIKCIAAAKLPKTNPATEDMNREDWNNEDLRMALAGPLESPEELP